MSEEIFFSCDRQIDISNKATQLKIVLFFFLKGRFSLRGEIKTLFFFCVRSFYTHTHTFILRGQIMKKRTQ